jgi:NodT family efflux transporter outer membrane factor (OMF) lipoprotein
VNGRARKSLIAAAACVLGGCAVGPDFQAPAAPTTGRYTAKALPVSTAASGTAAGPEQRLIEGRDIPSEWWALFRSEGIDSLMRQALAANPDLQAANAALRGARENVLAQQGAYFPSVDAQYNATRQGVATPVASPLASGVDTYTLHTAQLSIGYVPDVFGGNRRQVESLQAQADAQRYQLEAAHLTLAANLVEAVIQRASTRAQIEATNALIELSARQLGLLRRQQTLGQIGAADVAAQEAALALVQATLPPLQKQLAQQGNQLAVLVGALPSDATLPEPTLDQLQLPQELPLSLPAKLVEQRPDIRVAEAQLHAASAQVGVAAANRLPSFNLTAGVGSSALRFSQLFGAGTGFWSLGADVAAPIFDGGTLLHRQRAAQAGYDQAAAQYRSTVLTAFQNVADTLDAIQSDARALDAAALAERAAERSLAIARRQHAAGSAGVLVVLSAEQALRQASLGRIQAQANRLIDSAALFQALGGGWWNRSDVAAP